MEQDLLQSAQIRQRVKDSGVYAQNLYAALCNTTWQKNEAWEILKGSHWSISWRGAGRVVSLLKEEGNYMDWYCSGLVKGYDNEDLEPGYMPEGTVADHILNDLRELGWTLIKEDIDQQT